VRKFVKVSTISLCGSLLPLGLVVEFGAVSDKPHAVELLAQAQAISQPPWLYADAGYDTEKFNVQCREQWGCKVLSRFIVVRMVNSVAAGAP
jgi:hypothetical protein